MAINTGKSPGQIFADQRYTYPHTGDFGWRDITGEITTRGVGSTDPSWTQIGSGPFFAYAFAINDVAWLTYHVPHDIVPNALIHFHTHWITDGTNVNTVRWQFEYTFARGFNQAAFDATGTTLSVEESASGIAYQHMVTESTGQQILGLDEPDGIILCKVTRLTNGATDNTDNVYMLTADIHYQSTNSATYGKAPNFYIG